MYKDLFLEIYKALNKKKYQGKWDQQKTAEGKYLMLINALKIFNEKTSKKHALSTEELRRLPKFNGVLHRKVFLKEFHRIQTKIYHWNKLQKEMSEKKWEKQVSKLILDIFYLSDDYGNY